jgi:cytochrome c-type biogenesis protein CcmH/NrfG
MKKHITLFIAILLFSGLTAMASDPAKKLQKNPEAFSPEVREIIERVEEIKAIDFKALEKSERQELKAELKELKKEANKRAGSGIYISTAALIIIILLIILL